MSDFISHSQAGQDRFAKAVLESFKGPRRPLRFLDVGAAHPTDRSNTYALERFLGWRGTLIDRSGAWKELHAKLRTSPLIVADATEFDWELYLRGLPEDDRHTEYLSLDVDEATLDTIFRMPLDRMRFSVITVEHDAYRFGPEARWQIIGLLKQRGYDILCADVCDQKLPFEAWAVDPARVDMAAAERFRRGTPTEWREFFK